MTKLSVVALLAVVLAVAAFFAWPHLFPEEIKPKEPKIKQSAYIPPTFAAESLPALPFTDVTATSGITFVHENGAFQVDGGDSRYLPECMGPGVVLFDADGDGDADVYLPNGTTFPGQPKKASRPTGRLYRNDGAMNFTDVTEVAGLVFDFYGIGGAAADHDGDGDQDLLVTGWGGVRLFRNEGGLRFVDVTDAAGLLLPGWTDAQGNKGPDWSSSAAWFDADGDRDLDLFICNYVKWTPKTDVYASLDGRRKSFTVPDQYSGNSCRLFENQGDGTYRDITETAGVRNEDGKSLGIALWDFDADGRLDVVIANDQQPNFLYRNLGGGRFEERGADAGIAFDEDARTRAGMGIDVAEYLNDGIPGIPIGNFSGEEVALYRMDAPGFFRDVNQRAGIGVATKLALTFGLLYLDADLDGFLDIALANGHLEPHIEEVQEGIRYAQATQLLRNTGEGGVGRFLDWGSALGAAFSKPAVGRGLATADLDGDGDLDLVLGVNGGPPRVLRNDRANGAHWLRVRLVGRSPNTDALGAMIELTTGDGVQRRLVRTGSSYASQSEFVQTFGLGPKSAVTKLEVVWPDQRRTTVPVDGVDRVLVVKEPE